MKLLRVIIIIIILLGCYHIATGQIVLATYIDVKLLTVGDNKGNPALTIDVLGRLEWQGYQRGGGFLFVFPQ